MWEFVPSTQLISTIKEQWFTSLGALCISLMSGKLALTSPVDIFTESNNGDTFNWSHTPVYLITYRQRDKVGQDSVMLLHLNNSTQPHQERKYYQYIHTQWHQNYIHVFKGLFFICLSGGKQELFIKQKLSVAYCWGPLHFFYLRFYIPKQIDSNKWDPDLQMPA